MATTHSQELNSLIVGNIHNKEYINNINANISTKYSSIQIRQDQCSHIKDIKDTLDQLMGHSLNLSSSKQPSYHEYHDSSHYQGPPTFHEIYAFPELR
jgi:hypothetical protein